MHLSPMWPLGANWSSRPLETSLHWLFCLVKLLKQTENKWFCFVIPVLQIHLRFSMSTLEIFYVDSLRWLITFLPFPSKCCLEGFGGYAFAVVYPQYLHNTECFHYRTTVTYIKQDFAKIRQRSWGHWIILPSQFQLSVLDPALQFISLWHWAIEFTLLTVLSFLNCQWVGWTRWFLISIIVLKSFNSGV